MRDSPDHITATVVCPACGSELVAEALGAHGEYQCLACGVVFDASGQAIAG